VDAFRRVAQRIRGQLTGAAAAAPEARTTVPPPSGEPTRWRRWRVSRSLTAVGRRRAPRPSAGCGTASASENSTSNGPKDARSCTAAHRRGKRRLVGVVGVDAQEIHGEL
jgi:hypothetical protein